MAPATVDAGICGFATRIQAASPDMQTVQITYESDCPHVTCPLYCGFLKAIEVAAGMALPKDATISIDK
ncbi:MAG: hypothetical protein JSV89_02875 [Spirochaetaceae bacterium]|nr:MAG: hypothetical protein JSV89_02875 [Spirochaetaceae bacterium]